MRNKLGQFVEVRGDKNPRWLGDNVGYFGVHSWVYKTLGKATTCIDCGSTDWVQWANISRRYLRCIDDWKPLCSVCHRGFDGVAKLTKEEAIEIRYLYATGHFTQKELGKTYHVHDSTISNIVNKKSRFYG